MLCEERAQSPLEAPVARALHTRVLLCMCVLGGQRRAEDDVCSASFQLEGSVWKGAFAS